MSSPLIESSPISPKNSDDGSEKSVYTQPDSYEVVDGVLRMRPNSSIVPNYESVENEEVLWDSEELVSNNHELLRNNSELLRISGELFRNDGEMLKNEELLRRNEELLRRNEELLRRNEELLRFIEEVTKLSEEEEEEEEVRKLSEEEVRKLSEEEEEVRKLSEEEARKLSEEEARKLPEEEEVTRKVEVIVTKGFNCEYCGNFMRNINKFKNHVYGKKCKGLKKFIKDEMKKRKVTEEEVMKGIIINDELYPCNRCDFISSSKEELVFHLNNECKAAKNQHGAGTGSSGA